MYIEGRKEEEEEEEDEKMKKKNLTNEWTPICQSCLKGSHCDNIKVYNFKNKKINKKNQNVFFE